MSWNGSNGSETRSAKSLVKANGNRQLLLQALVFGVFLCTAVVVLWCFVFSRQPVVEEGNGVEIKKNIADNSKNVKSAKTVATVVEVEKIEEVKTTDSDRILLQTTTNALTGSITETYRTPDGKVHKHVKRPPPIFPNVSDQMIAMLVSAKSGQRIPPLPQMQPDKLDQAFAESLLSPITINENDLPEAVALKMAVKAVRNEIASSIKAGDTRNVSEILRDHVDQVNFDVELRCEAIRQLKKVLDEGDPEFSKAYLNKVNENLAKYGIDSLEMPRQSTERSNSK